jgi:single stranded DNA-binding protein
VNATNTSTASISARYAISNTRRGSGEQREEESTAIQWTLWGKQAENAAEYLGKGSHVNIVGRLRNNNYEKDGETVYGMAFTAEEIDYLDSRAESEARRNGGQGAEGVPAARSGPTINQTNQPQYKITVQGSASDPAATAKAIHKAMNNEPSIDWLLKNQKKVGHYFHELGVKGEL